jgi:uncharacterized coiled-coil protein SlyX
VGKRLITLEERLAFAEQTLEKLADVCTAIQARLDRFEDASLRIQSKIERLTELGLGEDLPLEKPPHY